MRETDSPNPPRAKPPRPGIREVARLAGVSPATASRALNGDARVHPELRQRVEQAAAQLVYRPNALARNLARQRSSTIGMIVADIEHPYFSAMVRAVEDLAYAQGHRVLVCNTDENRDKQRSYLRALEDERVSGLIVSPTDAAAPELSHLLDQGIPIVAFDRSVDDERADAVIPDSLSAARAATELLLEEGHRAIATIAGRPDVEAGAERLAGYKVAMRAAGLQPRVVQGDFRVDRAQEVVRDLLSEANPPSALVIANSPMTLGALKAIRAAGARAPDDISLVTIGEPPWAEVTDPPLTTFSPPIRRIAADAMELLLERMSGRRQQPQRVVHPFTLIRRQSTVRPQCGSSPQ